VLEPLSGYLMLCQALWENPQTAADAWNFGPRDEDARPVQWIVERLCELWGADARWTRDQGVHPHEAHYLKLDISKARAHLGWQPRWTLGEALDRIVAWHRAWRSSVDMHRYCFEELERFESASQSVAA
jgi:CDP-glucose 4,6-dehydratase